MSETNSPAPSDGLGDGTGSVPTTINVDVTTLSQRAASEYRQELLNASLFNPGIEFDNSGAQGEVDLAAYQAKIVEVNAYLATFPEKI